jgi:hypothetical protein
VDSRTFGGPLDLKSTERRGQGGRLGPGRPWARILRVGMRRSEIVTTVTTVTADDRPYGSRNGRREAGSSCALADMEGPAVKRFVTASSIPRSMLASA